MGNGVSHHQTTNRKSAPSLTIVLQTSYPDLTTRVVANRNIRWCSNDCKDVDTQIRSKAMNAYHKTLIVACTMVALATPSSAKQAKLDVSLAHPTLLSDSPQTTYVKVGLTGFELAPNEKRPPVNIALVIDKSGSMQGDKIEQAKTAAINALNMLTPDDIVSVIAYDTAVSVVWPATKLTDKVSVRNAISGIGAYGNTALFGGISKGAAEIRKFLARDRVNRVILLSDGLANVGPSSPTELGYLGSSLLAEGISVSTLGLGLGYNEDLMFNLAQASDGNHVFVEDPNYLAHVFKREFNDVTSVVAQEIIIRIECAPGVRPVRLLNIDGDISGQNVHVRMNQLYAGHEKYAILEVEVQPGEPLMSRRVANVNVSYANLRNGSNDSLFAYADADFNPRPSVVESTINKKVMAEVILQIANLQNELAVRLRDEGKLNEASRVLKSNGFFLEQNARKFESRRLSERADSNFQQSDSLDGRDWEKTKKSMRGYQRQDRGQQQVGSLGPN